MWCAMFFGGLTEIGTAGDGWCTLRDRRNIGEAVIVGCRLVRGRFWLYITSWIERSACCGVETSLQMVVSPGA